MARNVVKSNKKRVNRNQSKSNNRSSSFSSNNFYSHKSKKTVSRFVYEKELTLEEFANQSGITLIEIIKFFFNHKKILNVSSILNLSDVQLICEQMNIKLDVNVNKSNVEKLKEQGLHINDEDILADKELIDRPPVITVMGHVDHGKTSLLDFIKKSNVVSKESGGITQHLAAYTVHWKDQPIIFIDTPGHRAFTNMRERGAQVTDIVVLVVAADDGVKPQTIEAIEHAKAANVPIIVAVNKIDKPEADVEKVRNELSKFDLLSEEWGGSTIYVDISALKGDNVDVLLDNIITLSEILELKAVANDDAAGLVLEAHLDPKVGNFATLIVQRGSLGVNSPVLFNNEFSKIRILTDELGQPIKVAPTGSVCVVGSLACLPESGNYFKAYSTEKAAKAAIVATSNKRADYSSFSVFASNYDANNDLHVNVVIKTDVTGTATALKNYLQDLTYKDKIIRILRFSAGQITDDDVSLASASHAVIIAFNTGCNSDVASMIADKKVDVFYCNVIYNAEEYLLKKMKAKVEPVYKDVTTGSAEVRAVFKLSTTDNLVAGCYMSTGFIDLKNPIKYYRNDKLLYEGNILSLRHLKSVIKRTKVNQEFGIIIRNFNDFKENDVIKGYFKEEVESD